MRRIFSVLFMMLAVATLAGCGVNNVPTLEEQAKTKWADVQVQYQRRADLIPNLVATVKGYAKQEKEVLAAVIQARAAATQVKVDAGTLTDPAAFAKFQEAQGQVGSTLARLMAVSENYPELRSNQNFLALQSQIEGTENRIAVARRDYNEAVRLLNTELKTIPGKWIAAWLYPQTKPMELFAATTPEAQNAPTVSFFRGVPMGLFGEPDALIPRRRLAVSRLPACIAGLAFILFFLNAHLGHLVVGYTPKQGLDFPALSGRVVDGAAILSPADEAYLSGLSENLEAQTGAQFVVATLPSLENTTIEDYGYQLGRHWGIGRKGHDDGVLLLVAPREREMRIEVGYGLEGVLTDALTATIIQTDMLPAFRAGDLPKGIRAGARAVVSAVLDPENKGLLPADTAAGEGGQGGFAPPKGEGATQNDWALAFILLIVSFLPIAGIVEWMRCLFNPAYGAQLVRRPRSGGGGFGGFGGGRGGSSGGGFSGRGGGFGGGGSSGRW